MSVMFVKRCGFNQVTVQMIFFKDVFLIRCFVPFFLQIDRKVPVDEKKLQALNMQNVSRIKTLFDKIINLNNTVIKTQDKLHMKQVSIKSKMHFWVLVFILVPVAFPAVLHSLKCYHQFLHTSRDFNFKTFKF